MYLVAIIVPTLNEECFIGRCLDSIISQSFPFEKMDVMVIDGRSSDKTREIVEKYQAQYDNIRLLDNPQKIQSIAFNIGVKESDAPYLIRLDAHALYDEKYIELCVRGLSEDLTRGNVGGICEIISQNDSIMPQTNTILNFSKFGIGGARFRVGGLAGNVDTVPFGAFPRCVIDKVGGMREDLPRGEDNEFNSRIKKAGYNIYFNPLIKCKYFARATFKASMKQMFANGESIGILFYIDKNAIQMRHIIPMFFVIGLFGGFFLSFFMSFIFYAYILGIVLYFVCDLLASFIAAKKYGWKFLFPLFYLFFMVHISYGLGTIKGLLEKKY